MIKIKEYFPKDKKQWMIFFAFAIPTMMQAMIFSFNGVIDNFMVGSIDGGSAALSAANAWTRIIIGIFTAITLTGSILGAQYYGAKNYKKTKETLRIRILLNIIVSLVMFTFIQLLAKDMVQLFAQINPADDKWDIVNQSTKYLIIVSYCYLMMGISDALYSTARETGFPKFGLIASSVSILLNIIFNVLFIIVLKWGIVGAAYATLISRGIELVVYILFFALKKDFKIRINIFDMFKISKDTIIKFSKMWAQVLAISLATTFIVFRTALYNAGYPIGSISDKSGVAPALSITLSIVMLVLSTSKACSGLVAVFVGQKLGEGQIQEAKENSKRLFGFIFVIIETLCFILIIVAFCIPYMTFLYSRSDHVEILKIVKYSLLVIAIFAPLWELSFVALHCVKAGGNVRLIKWSNTVDFMTAGPIGLSWLAIVMFVIVPATNISFPVAYFLFFLSDILRCGLFLFMYFKSDWAHKISMEEEKSKVKDQIKRKHKVSRKVGESNE